MSGSLEKNTTPPAWLPVNVPKEHYSGFVYSKDRPCVHHQEHGLGCYDKEKIEAVLWQHRQSNGSLYQIYRCLECGCTISSSVKQISDATARTDDGYKEIVRAYQERLAEALPNDLGREEFLRSPEWQAIRTRILALDGYACRVCGAAAEDVHHRSNENYRNPKDKDLVSLCRRCHEAIHCLNPFERKEKLESKEWPGHDYPSRLP